MSTPTAAQFHEFEIPAGATHTAYGEGDSFLVVASNVRLEIMREGAPFLPYEQGDREDLPPGVQFARLEVKNPTLVGAFVKLYSGFGRRQQARAALIDGATEITGSAQTTIANNEAIVFAGSPPVGYIRRRSITVSNEDPTARLRMRDAAGRLFATIEPKSTQIHFVSGSVTLFNNSGGAVVFCAGEAWFVP
jgi:hypothetical protein